MSILKITIALNCYDLVQVSDINESEMSSINVWYHSYKASSIYHTYEAIYLQALQDPRIAFINQELQQPWDHDHIKWLSRLQSQFEGNMCSNKKGTR